MSLKDIEMTFLGWREFIPEIAEKSDAELRQSLIVSNDHDDHVSSSSGAGEYGPRVNKFLPPCEVCGGVSTGIHFGANTCEPCKTFFRRTLGNQSTISPCKKVPSGKCTVNAKGKLLCTYCRHQRCLAVGMRKDGVKKGRHSYATKTQQVKNYQLQKSFAAEQELLNDVLLEQKLADAVNAYSVVFPDQIYCIQNKAYIDNRIKRTIVSYNEPCCNRLMYSPGSMGFQDMKKKFDSLEVCVNTLYQNPGLLDENVKSLKDPHILASLKILWQTWMTEIEISFRSLTRFAKQIPGFPEIPIEDRIVIMKESRNEALILNKHLTTNLKEQLFCKYSVEHDEMVIIPINLMVSNITGEEYFEDQYRLTEKLQSLGLMAEDMVVLLILIILSPDRDGLQDSNRISQLQEEWIPVLKYSLRKNHPNSPSLLADTLLLLPMFRQNSDLNKKAMNKATKLVEPELSPLLHEVLFTQNSSG